MINIPLTLSSVFDLGLACTREIHKDLPKEKQKEAELNYAMSFLTSLSRAKPWRRWFIF